MKTLFSAVFGLFLLGTLSAQDMSPRFQMAMGKTLGKYADCKTAADYAELAAGFDRIARRDTGQWLPQYYQVHALVLASFTENNPDQKETYLNHAEPTLNALLASQSQNAEIHVLHGMYYTARLVVDPATRGQKYGALSAQAVAKGKALDPTNPRVAYMEIANGMGTARFFGSDISEYCTAAQKAYDSFDDYQVASRIHPNWGKSQLAEQAQACNP